MKYKKLLLGIGFTVLVFVLSSCQNSAPPATSQYTVNGLWSMTLSVTKSNVSGTNVGDSKTHEILLETSGNTITLRYPNSSDPGLKGIRTGNHISLNYKDSSLSVDIQGNFLSKKVFSGTAITASQTSSAKIFYDVTMSKR